MQLHKKNLCFFPFCSHLQQSLRIHPGASWRSGAVPEVKSQGEGKSQGLWAARGPLPQLCHPWKGKVLVQTRDTHISPASETQTPHAACTAVSCCSEHLSNPFPNNLILKTVQLVVNSCCPGTPVMCAGERCCLSRRCQTYNTWSIGFRPNLGLFSTFVLQVTLPDPVLSHSSRRNTCFKKDFPFGQG